MGLKYYLPDNYANLLACEGFYIDNQEFFGTERPNTEQWDNAIKKFIDKIHRFVPALHAVNDWETSMGVNRYVLLKSSSVQVVMGDDDRYVSMFVIIPENSVCTKNSLREYESALSALSNYLARKYPEKVFNLKNSWNLEPLKVETNVKIKSGGGKGFERLRKTA